MINYKNDILEIINKWNADTVHILADFDRTLTVGESESSWGILSTGNFIKDEYKNERQRLYDYYRPIEIDETMDFESKNKLMVEWWTKHISLFIKYKLTEDVIIDAVKDIKVLKFRDGARELLESLNDKNIPVVIISAGIGNIIVEFLKNNNCYFDNIIIISAGIGNVIEEFLRNNNCYFDNIYIVSNFIKFENGVAIGLEENIIHSLNKNEALLPDKVKKIIKDRHNIILLGDQIADAKMAPIGDLYTTVKIGFCEENVEENYKYFEKTYDIVCTNKANFKDLAKEINLFK